MSNIFSKMKDYVEKPNRNTFDLSFQNNLTMEFGKLYPVFCKEVVPGDSMRIKPTFGLRFMPLVFPVQTRMQANLHFFYVRNRNLWKDWPDFIGRTKKNLVLPFLSPAVAKKVCKTRGLGDYLGLPTTLAGEYGSSYYGDLATMLYNLGTEDHPVHVNYPMSGTENDDAQPIIFRSLSDMVSHADPQEWATSYYENAYRSCGSFTDPIDLDKIQDGEDWTEADLMKIRMKAFVPSSANQDVELIARIGLLPQIGEDFVCMGGNQNMLSSWTSDTVNLARFVLPSYQRCAVGVDAWYNCPYGSGFQGKVIEVKDVTMPSEGKYMTLEFSFDWRYAQWYLHDSAENLAPTHVNNLTQLKDYMKRSYGTTVLRLGFVGVREDVPGVTLPQTHLSGPSVPAGLPGFTAVDGYSLLKKYSEVADLSDLPVKFNPYAKGDIKVSALPFRAYESIYNAFYRNQFNDPFTINGVKEFNKFITNDEGGEDTVDYDLYHRNYEQDFLTSAKQSPVDGDITPLVGVSGTGTFTFQNADGSQVNITPKFAEDGTTIIGLETIEGTPENTSSIRRLMDMASVGISINDFRNVNALQRWLETNLRRGYRYKDQLMSHFGVEAKFDVLDMPEFIGGMSEPVIVNQINQSVDQTGDSAGLGDFSKVLGSFAGQASVLAQSKHDVEKYCDEHGFIIGILSITPVPNYSQLLPKFFLKNNVLDYYFPEFGHIGNQPIPYSEVCPLQSYAAGDPLTDVFGYNRAWYDYLASVDEVHGDFRTSLEGFLINRVFDERPELGKDFLEVDPDDMSNPFSVTDKTDKILGQLYFEVTAQRPIPKFGIPRLE